MLSKRDLKVWLRSGSWRFMRDARATGPVEGLSTYRWNGHPIAYRAGTSDCRILYDVLLKGGRKAEYWLPEGLRPRTILDIGGNIGITSLYLARRFPDASIHVFEPAPQNVVLLQRNIAPYPHIKVHAVALGSTDGELDMFDSDDPQNFGGFSQCALLLSP